MKKSEVISLTRAKLIYYYYFTLTEDISFLAFRDKERERNIYLWPFCIREWTCNLGVCPDWHWTSDFSMSGTMLQLSHTNQGKTWGHFTQTTVGFVSCCPRPELTGLNGCHRWPGCMCGCVNAAPLSTLQWRSLFESHSSLSSDILT